MTALDRTGYSAGYDVVGPDGRKWKVKLGDEAQAEVVASRVLWAIGFHQPPTYLISGLRLSGGKPEDQGRTARLRLEEGYRTEGQWSWQQNPYVGVPAYRGLLVANLILNNWDLKTSNNRIYLVSDAAARPARRFVVQDLGASLGKTGWPTGNRNNVAAFESQRLIDGVRDGLVDFDYHGRHGELFNDITPADVVWTSRLLVRLSDEQWHDAFRAAAYPAPTCAALYRQVENQDSGGLALEARAAAQPSMTLRFLVRAVRSRALAVAAIFVLAGATRWVVAAQPQIPPSPRRCRRRPAGRDGQLPGGAAGVGVRLPLAALLGTVLALRPRRGGTPERQPAVVQTQIILAVVGSLIMLVVGASLARAFGIVGAANLIRYRSKIDDPKDAVVMLCALSVGLAAGVGLYGLAVDRHAVHHALPVDHRGLRAADALLRAHVKLGDKTADLRPQDRGGPAALQGALRAARPRRKRTCLHGDRRRSRCAPTASRTRSWSWRPTARAKSSGKRNPRPKTRSRREVTP